jgi:anti-sigma regulatory factor (Ser/Thr protein kinase)
MSFHEVMPAVSGCLVRLRAMLRTWAASIGLDGRQTADLLLATGEACANVIEHAYPRDRPIGPMEVNAEQTRDGTIVIQVRDTGRWRRFSDGVAAHRGRGLALIRATMRTVEVDSRPTGTTVTMHMV